MRKILVALASVTALTLPAQANAQAQINFGATTTIPNSNDFKGNLNGLNLTRYATTGASIIIDPGYVFDFYYVGAESGFSDTFTTAGGLPNLSYTELANNNENHFGAPIYIGSDSFTAGSLAGGLLKFTSSGPGAVGTVGTDPFAIFLGANQVSGTKVSDFYFGYDDQLTNVDDNHDDFVIHAVMRAVPEPATWAMMLVGFAGIGLVVRRQGKPMFSQLA